jgi:hypothetical protein
VRTHLVFDWDDHQIGLGLPVERKVDIAGKYLPIANRRRARRCGFRNQTGSSSRPMRSGLIGAISGGALHDPCPAQSPAFVMPATSASKPQDRLSQVGTGEEIRGHRPSAALRAFHKQSVRVDHHTLLVFSLLGNPRHWRTFLLATDLRCTSCQEQTATAFVNCLWANEEAKMPVLLLWAVPAGDRHWWGRSVSSPALSSPMAMGPSRKRPGPIAEYVGVGRWTARAIAK